MTFNNDRQLTISTAGSRTARLWQPQTLWWSELCDRLKVPARGTETLQEYLKLPKRQQDDLKDVGGFVGGTLAGGHRKASAVTGRDLLTLDLDNVPAGGTDDVLKRLDSLGCGYAVYSTRKHEPGRPRLRCLFPLDRTATADEYEPLARKMADLIGMTLMDPTTFEASRLMYWPSCCRDSQYTYQAADKPFLSADGLLAMYHDWRDIDEWPVSSAEGNKHVRLAAKQGNPLEKRGIVGAFCRQYDVYQAMDKFLPGVYEQVETKEDRYTFIDGSTVGGAIVYENGLYLYSHHATDPCSGRLVNSFDLVRLHKFGDMDDEVKPETPINRLPSYVAMKRFARQDPIVSGALAEERYESAQKDFGADADDSDAPSAEEDFGGQAPEVVEKKEPVHADAQFMTHLAVDTNGKPEKTIANVQYILENDPNLAGRIRWDSFSETICAVAPLPWEPRRHESGVFEWKEKFDDNGLMGYIEQLLKTKDRQTITAALLQVAARHAFNPITEFITRNPWDGEPRLETLFIDALGAQDTVYVRQATRKQFIAGVARAAKPGVKYDYMLVLTGGQGLGKTSLLEFIGDKWYNGSMMTFEGKDAMEALKNAWIVNIDEMHALHQSDIKLMKSFITRRWDNYRGAYGRKTEKHDRRCIFFGTSNNAAYLQDPTGNRRFYPIDVGQQRPKLRIYKDQKDKQTDEPMSDLPLIDEYYLQQIWAEAYHYYQLGEGLELEGEAAEEAKRQQEAHREQDSWEAAILEFVDRPVPKDWNTRGIDRRKLYWSGEFGKENVPTQPRDRICAQEVWCECLGNRIANMRRNDTVRINDILANISGWERVPYPYRFGPYGKIKGGSRRKGGTT